MRNVVLTSGGIDSAVCLALSCFRDGPAETTALGIAYGQRHINELTHARALAQRCGCTWLVSHLDPSPWKRLPLMTGTTASDRPVYAMRGGGVSDAFLPGRNVAFLGIAHMVAGVTGADRVWIGATRDDAAGFPDCRPTFVQAWEEAASLALGRPLALEAPLLELDKRGVVQLARAMALDLEATWSCYRPQDTPRGAVPCGRCDACILRRDALRDGA